MYTGGGQSLKQYKVRAHHKDQVVEEVQSFSSTRPTALSRMGFEHPGGLQQSIMITRPSVKITRPSDHKLTSEIMDAPTITNFQVFEPLILCI